MEESTQPKVVPLPFETYLQVVKNSVGSNTFRNFYAQVNEQKQDILRDGELSCAFFVSSILVLFKLIKSGHATVDGTVKDLEASGWQKTNTPKPGDIIVWAKQRDERGEEHGHIGFCVGENEVISNSSQARTPMLHDLNYRPVETCYTTKI